MDDFDDPFGEMWDEPQDDFDFDDADLLLPADFDDPIGEPASTVPAPPEADKQTSKKASDAQVEEDDVIEVVDIEDDNEPKEKKVSAREKQLQKARTYIHPRPEELSRHSFPVSGLGSAMITNQFSLNRYLSLDDLEVEYPTTDLKEETAVLSRFCSDPLHTLLERYEKQEKQRAAQKMEAIRVARVRKRRGKRKDNLHLWNDKYRPAKFQQLISDDAINREVLDWMRRFERLVRGEEPYPDIEGDENKPEVPRMCLLGGDAGVGKTTLAKVLATTYKYRVNVLNASDCRTADQIRRRIEEVASSTTFHAEDSIQGVKGQLLIIDEIDGVATTGGAEGNKAIGAIVKIIQADKKKSDPNAWTIKKPIIAICNDLKAKSLRDMHIHTKIVQVTKPDPIRLKQRLKQICNLEEVIVRDEVLRILVEESRCDIRCCLNTLQLLSTNRLEITPQDMKKHIARGGLKENAADHADLLALIFQLRAQRRDVHKNPQKLMKMLSHASADFNFPILAQQMILNTFQLSFPDRILSTKHICRRLAAGEAVDRASFRLNAWEIKPYALLIPVLTACDLLGTDSWTRKTRLVKWDQKSADFREFKRQQDAVLKDILKFKVADAAPKKDEIQEDPYPARNKAIIFRLLGSSRCFGFRDAPFLTFCLNPVSKKEWYKRRGRSDAVLDNVDGNLKSLETAIQLCVDFGLKMKEENAGPRPDISCLATFHGLKVPQTAADNQDMFDQEIHMEVLRRTKIRQTWIQAAVADSQKYAASMKLDFPESKDTPEAPPAEEVKAPPPVPVGGSLLDFFKVIKKKSTKRNADSMENVEQNTQKVTVIRHFNYSYLDGHTNAVFRRQKVNRFIL
eukprot:GEMP01012525.1.p1 GENE.GEMP01012525.1~~GEMP01012525.1.p1  ORF type:complete len:866 (+),score=168.54 GEMP01012525.1:43-2598(+)